MSEFLTDKEQMDVIKKWWRDYGRSIAIAVVLGLGIGFGWRYWHEHKLQNAERASTLYEQMLVANAKQDFTTAQAFSKQILAKYRRSPYAAMASLLTAKEAILNNNLSLAFKNLEWVVKNSGNKRFTQIARIRAARVLLAQKQPEAALKIIATVDDKAFLPAIEQVKGDIYMAQGHRAQAKQAYQAAKLGLLELGTQDPYLAMKMAQ